MWFPHLAYQNMGPPAFSNVVAEYGAYKLLQWVFLPHQESIAFHLVFVTAIKMHYINAIDVYHALSLHCLALVWHICLDM